MLPTYYYYSYTVCHKRLKKEFKLFLLKIESEPILL